MTTTSILLAMAFMWMVGVAFGWSLCRIGAQSDQAMDEQREER